MTEVLNCKENIRLYELLVPLEENLDETIRAQGLLAS
jgi:hypothetical protein